MISVNTSAIRLLIALFLLIAFAPGLPADEVPKEETHLQGSVDSDLPEEAAAVLYRPVETRHNDFGPQTKSIRVLVHYGRTEFFVSNGKMMGLEYEAFAEYEKFLNAHRKKHTPKIRITFIPVNFDDLIPLLLEGKGDVAAGLITVTEKRAEKVAFTKPYVQDVAEVLVAFSKAVQPESLKGLSGRTVHVLRGSSFTQHLTQLNERFAAEGLAPIKVVELPASANADDILEMVNAGIFELTFVDDCVADLWSQALPDIRVLRNIILSTNGDFAWAVRPDNPELLKNMNSFVDYGKAHLQAKGAEVWRRYFKDTKLLKNPLRQEEAGRVKQLSPHFKSAGEKHKMDWLMMMAQGYQESELNQKVKSPKGAVGVMQILPDTARSIGYKDVSKASNNIHAGVAYLDHIRKNFFNEPGISPDARVDFALAAYNAGPSRVQWLRQEAGKRGLDPNIWFNNVERVALDKIGEETVRYVANVNRYYIAYRMSHNLDDYRTKAVREHKAKAIKEPKAK